MADADPLQSFRFRLEIDGLDMAGFSEVTGLSSEYEVIEYREGADVTTGVRKLPGLRKYTNVTLKRGITRDKRLWEWHASIAGNPGDRRSVTIGLLGEDDAPICRWKLRRAWPAKYEGPSLAAQDSGVAVETLVFAHEGLELEAD